MTRGELRCKSRGGCVSTQVADLGTKYIDCAWCSSIFEDLIELLTHVEECHLDAAEHDLEAAA